VSAVPLREKLIKPLRPRRRNQLPHLGLWCANGHVLSGGLRPESDPPPRACELHDTHLTYRCPMRHGAYWCNDEVVDPPVEMVWDPDAGESRPCFEVIGAGCARKPQPESDEELHPDDRVGEFADDWW